MTDIDRSRQAALEALKSSSTDELSDRFVTQAVEIAYQHQFSPDDRSAAKRALREAVLAEAQRRQSAS